VLAGGRRSARADAVATALAVALVCLATGFLVGLGWWWVAPLAQVRVDSGSAYLVTPQPEQFVASDAWFGSLTALAGLVLGVAVWWRTRQRPLAGLVGLTVGCVVAALAAWRFGEWLGRVDLDAVARLPAGSLVEVALRLTAQGLLVVLVVVGVGAWLVCDLVSDVRDRRRARLAVVQEEPPDPSA
jgi:hypothetical protein